MFVFLCALYTHTHTHTHTVFFYTFFCILSIGGIQSCPQAAGGAGDTEGLAGQRAARGAAEGGEWCACVEAVHTEVSCACAGEEKA